MVSEVKTASRQLDLLMEALKTSIREALDADRGGSEASAGSGEEFEANDPEAVG